MAQLLIAQDHIPPDPLTIRLREELPDDVVVVVGAQVDKTSLQIVVLAAHGCLILHPCVTHQEMQPAQRQRINDALARFLGDEFPQLRPEVRHLVVLLEGETPETVDPGWESVVVQAQLIPAVNAVAWPEQAPLLDEATRRLLGVALCERRLTTNQRAAAPFVFRSGGRFGQRRQAWTIRAVVEHLDRYPEDGIYHLRNGTLLQWFEEQGATHLARAVRSALQTASGDYRAVLETFLLDTGLVPAPTLVVKPATLSFGSVASGATVAARLTVRRGSGRGYLVGSVRSLQPWVRVEPNQLQAGQLEAIVQVDTTTLPIQAKPHVADLRIVSNSQTPDRTIPVQVRVAGAQATFWYRRMRMLGWAALFGVFGGLTGWWLSSTVARDWGYSSTSRWIGVGVGLVCIVGVLAWSRLTTRQLEAPVRPSGPPGRHPSRIRPVGAWLEACLAAALIGGVLLFWLRPTLLEDELVAVEGWAAGPLTRLESDVDRLVDAWMLRTYDRRAPSLSPLATPESRQDEANAR